MSQRSEGFIIKKVDSSEIKFLLECYDLPTSDLNPVQSIFLGVFKSERLIGCIGIEKIAELALLRSLVVQADFRKQGLGILLTNTILKEAKERSLFEVYLLTTDAEPFFEKAGFSKIVKNKTPDVVKKTKQYSEICSDSAVVMKIDLT